MCKLSKKQKLFRIALLPLLKHPDSVGCFRVKWSKDGESVKVGKVVLKSVKECITLKNDWLNYQDFIS